MAKPMNSRDLLNKAAVFQGIATRKLAQTASKGDPLGGMSPEQLTSLPLEQVENNLFGPVKNPLTFPKPGAKPAAPPAAMTNVQPTGDKVNDALKALLAPYGGYILGDAGQALPSAKQFSVKIQLPAKPLKQVPPNFLAHLTQSLRAQKALAPDWSLTGVVQHGGGVVR